MRETDATCVGQDTGSHYRAGFDAAQQMSVYLTTLPKCAE